MAASTPTAWERFRETHQLGSDGRSWWRLLETAADASADDVIAFLRAAHHELEMPNLWQPMFDPLLAVDGLAARWREIDEPLRSSIAYGLVRVGRLSSEVLPAGICERVAGEYVERETHALSEVELAWQASLWPTGRFRAALQNAALAYGDNVPLSVVRFAREKAAPRDAVELMLIADGGDDELAERSPAWRMLEGASPAEVDALAARVEEWLVEPERATPQARFRASVALLDRGLFEARHDALLPAEMLDWQGDLACDLCGLCGDELVPSQPGEPSLGVVLLLARLPRERRERFLTASAQNEARRTTAELVASWLREPRDVIDADARVAKLPPEAREAIALAWARLAVARDGHLPRLLQREVIATFWPEPETPAPASKERVLRNMRARVLRLVELGAPIQVLLRQASRFRAVERLPESNEEPDVVSASEVLGWKRKTALLRLMLERLGSADPRVRLVIEDLAALEGGGSVTAWSIAEALEAESEAQPQGPHAAISHFAFCALDDATGEARRTDQDDLGDIAVRAVIEIASAKVGDASSSPPVIEACRTWWQTWLVELVPAAYR